MLQTSRRSLITGLVSFLVAPAVVRAASLMPVKALPTTLTLQGVPLTFDGGYPLLLETIRKAFLPRLRVQLYADSKFYFVGYDILDK